MPILQIYLLVVVFGWAIVLDRIVNNAAKEVGVQASYSRGLRIWCFVPVLTLTAIAFPRIFFPGSVASELKARRVQSRWYNYVRFSAAAYLALLFVLPVLFLLVTR